MAEAREHEIAGSPFAVSLGDLFLAFLRITLSGFGGTLPFARQTLVLDRRWLSEQQFVEALSLCQFLPGPNVVNLSIVVGQRFRGVVARSRRSRGWFSRRWRSCSRWRCSISDLDKYRRSIAC